MRETAIETAMWAGDTDRLREIAPCRCCCVEHTFSDCAARQWGACRGGQGPTPQQLQEEWVRHYERFHGMSRERFFS